MGMEGHGTWPALQWRHPFNTMFTYRPPPNPKHIVTVSVSWGRKLTKIDKKGHNNYKHTARYLYTCQTAATDSWQENRH